MIAGEEGDAAEVNPHVALADAFACGAYRNGRNRLNADLQLFPFIDLANRAVHHDAFPLVLRRQPRQLCVNQRAPH
ncbi:hypothetical protein E05_31900 [Plautia stali symbiont]|nr:hypothetical protein E05_31900 [Plautia stali symbiont]